jgi:hypothetical protein
MRKKFEDELNRRTQLYPLPPTDFDPMHATNATLAGFGLLARPDARKDPNLFAFWSLLFSEPLEIIQPIFGIRFPATKRIKFRYHRNDARPKSPFSSHRHGSPPTKRGGIAHSESSRNWAGAYLSAPFPDRFNKVTASWSVPTPEVPDVQPDPPDPLGLSFRSSTWVGLDGHRTYPHASMPQAGTAQQVDVVGAGKALRTYLWWQWWSKDGDSPEIQITNVPTAMDDRIAVALTVVSSDEVQFNLKNQTTGRFVTFLAQAPPGSPPIGATAEWIMERPTEVGSAWLYRLPNYTAVNFANCLAQSGSSPLGPSRTHALAHPHFVRMFEIFEGPHRQAFVSIPKRMGHTSLRVMYREAR